MQRMQTDPTTGLPSPFVRAKNSELGDGSTDPAQGFLQKAQASQLKETLTPELDPSTDLTPFEQAAKDQFAKNPVKADKTPLYFGADNIDKSSEQIVYDQFAPKVKALDAAQNELDRQLQAHKHSSIIAGIEGSGVVSDVNAGTNPEGANQGLGDLSGVTTPQGGAQTPNQGAQWVQSPEYQRTSKRLEQEYGNDPNQPAPAQLQAPNQKQMWLGLLLAAASGFRALPQIAGAMFQTADEQRQFMDKANQAQYAAQVHGHDSVVKALEQHLRTIEQMDAAAYRGRVSTDNNIRTTTTSATNTDKREAGLMTRQERDLKANDEIAHMNDGTKRYIAGLKDPVEKVKALVGMGYDAETARDLANSEDLNRMARTAKTNVETTYLQRTLATRIADAAEVFKKHKAEVHYTQTRDKYTQELTRLLPQKLAVEVAGLLATIDYHDKLLNLANEKIDAAEYATFGKVYQTGVDAAQEALDDIDLQLREGIDSEGNTFKADPSDATYTTLVNRKKLLEAARDAAKFKLEQAEQDKKNAGGPFAGFGGKVGNGPERKPLFNRGKRPSRLPGGVPSGAEQYTAPDGKPVDPASIGQGILDKLKGSTNDYAEALA